MSDFDRCLDRAIAVVDRAAKASTGAVAGAVFRELGEATPVKTGRTRGAWTVNAGREPRPATGVLETAPQGAPSPREQAEAQTVELETARLPLGTPAVVANALPHASIVVDAEGALERADARAAREIARLLDPLELI